MHTGKTSTLMESPIKPFMMKHGILLKMQDWVHKPIHQIHCGKQCQQHIKNTMHIIDQDTSQLRKPNLQLNLNWTSSSI